ncbi:MAG: ABC transporter permease [Solimonas sp.]
MNMPTATRSGCAARGNAAPARAPFAERLLASPASAWISPLLLLVAWTLAVRSGLFSEQILASPWQIVKTAAALIRSGELPHHLAVSLGRLLGGFALGTIAGVLFGAALARVRLVEPFFGPLFQVLRQLPSIALIPMFILLFGIGETFKVVLVLKATFFVVALATYDAVRQLPPAWLEVAGLYRLPARVQLWRLLLPGALPAILTGARIALGRSWMVLVGAELLASESGIGQMMEMARQLFQLDVVMVGVVVTGLVGFALDRGFRLIERAAIRGKAAA